MILPSLNPVNCWKPVKPLPYNVAGNGERERLKRQGMKQSAISIQAVWKQVEGSTTRESSLNRNFLRHGGISKSAGVFLATLTRLNIGASTFFASMMKSGLLLLFRCSISPSLLFRKGNMI
jgi:hypothetical protein